jgi:hypothetical protein
MITKHPQKITFGEMRSAFWPDHLRLSDIEDRFVCRVCGKRGADIRPDFPQGRMSAG